MKKRIEMKIINDTIMVTMNNEELFTISLQNKEIKLEELYNKMNINVDDEFIDEIENLDEQNKSAIHFLYENTKLFLSTLILKLNASISTFNEEKEKKILMHQS